MSYLPFSVLKKIDALLLLLLIYNLPVLSQCNGFDYLCDRKYDEVAYLTTHNAYNSEADGFLLPNHNLNMATQLEDGVRGLMIDVYEVEDTLMVYHTTSVLGSAPLLDYLVDIKDFLEAHPKEIVTIILECYTSANAIEADLAAAGLMDYLYTQTAGEEWATLQTMIDQNTRLVIFSDVNDATPQQAWYHYVWDFAVETPFSVRRIESFNCDWNRGNPQNDLFILNHFITNIAGVGVADDALVANSNPFFMDRIAMCEDLTGKFPNFITIDFHELGDCLEVVEQLNETKILSHISTTAQSSPITLYPNPTSNILNIEQHNISADQIQIFTATGQLMNAYIPIKIIHTAALQLDFSAIPKGVYLIRTNNTTTKVVRF